MKNVEALGVGDEFAIAALVALNEVDQGLGAPDFSFVAEAFDHERNMFFFWLFHVKVVGRFEQSLLKLRFGSDVSRDVLDRGV